MNKIITISRECGTGGHIIGEKLAKKLGVDFYDREIIEQTAKKSGFTNDFVEEQGDRITNSILFNIANSLTYANQVFAGNGVSLADKVFFVQCDVIKELAAKGPCVFVGRCADYVLKDREDCINVFVHGKKEDKIKHYMETNQCSAKEAESAIKKRDKSRANFYRYYTDSEWGVVGNYDITLDSASIGIDQCVDILYNICVGK